MNNNDTIPSIKIQMIWNTISGIVGALEAVFMTIITTRVIGLNAAGELTIAFALGNLFRTVGLWGTRNFHVSDQKNEYSFFDYLILRFFSLDLMIFCIVFQFFLFFFLRNESIQKLFVIFLIEMVFLVESFEDLIAGEYQRKGRVDIGAKLFLIRWVSLLIVFSICVFTSKSLLLSLSISFIFSTVAFFLSFLFIYKIPIRINLDNSSFERNKIKIKALFNNTFPLFLMSFFVFFLNNIAKYSLDFYFDDDIQAYYGFISLPVFAVELFSWFIYQPKLASVSVFWVNDKINDFIREVVKQIIYIFVIIIIFVICGYFLGIPILSFVFGANLCTYKKELIYNLLYGGAMAYVVYCSTLLTIMRRQKLQLFIYGISSIIGGIFIWLFVKRYCIFGAAIGNLIVFFIQMILMYGSFIILIFKKDKNIK